MLKVMYDSTSSMRQWFFMVLLPGEELVHVDTY